MELKVKCDRCQIDFLKKAYRIREKNYCSRKCACWVLTLKRWDGHCSIKQRKCPNCNKTIHYRNKSGICFECKTKLKLHIVSLETKQKISIKRKEYLKNNPNKHPWKNKNKFKSIPCDKFKSYLDSGNYKYIEEYQPLNDFNYSIDVAFPDKKIGIEINGNQHYNRDGMLKPYYQKRHDLIEASGWRLYEIPYMLCFDEGYVINLVKDILGSEKKIEFNYEEYIKWKLNKSKYSSCDLCSCGGKKYNKAVLCAKCDAVKRRKIAWPSKSVLHYLIWNYSCKEISKMLKVSDTSIKKWIKIHDLGFPKRGHWNKYFHGYIIDYQI